MSARALAKRYYLRNGSSKRHTAYFVIISAVPIRSRSDRFCNVRNAAGSLLCKGNRWLDYIQRSLSRATLHAFFTLVNEQQKTVNPFCKRATLASTMYFAKGITHHKHRIPIV